MKSLLIALLISAPLAAEGVSPTAQAAMATPAATPVAAAMPVATPEPFDESKAVHSGFYVPYWSAALHLAGAMPLGDLGQYNGLGFGAQLDAIYHPADRVQVDAFVLTNSLPAIEPTADARNIYLGTSSPLQLTGVGLKGGYIVYRSDAMTLGVNVGMGYGSIQRTAHTVVATNYVLDQETWQLSGTQLSALLLCGGVQVTYQIMTSLDLVMSLDYIYVDLGGGTSDTPAIGLPSIGVQYDFD